MTGLYVDSIKDASNTKTLATLSSSAVTLDSSVVVPPSIGGTMCYIDKAVSSGSTAIMEFDNLDNSYTYYKFALYSILPVTDSVSFYASLFTGSAYLAGSSDYINGASQYTNDGATYNNVSGYLAWAYGLSTGASVDAGLNGELNLWNCSNTSIPTSANWKWMHTHNNGKVYGNDGFGTTNTTSTAVTKIKFFFGSSSNFASGSTIIRYGVKNG